MLVFVNWAFFILGMVGVFILRRRRKDLIRPDAYQTPGYPVVPIIGIIGALYIVVMTLLNAIQTGAWNILLGVAAIVIGVPVYFLLKKYVQPPVAVETAENVVS